MNIDEAQLPGWFGKMPSLGDFASRRLPSRFLVAWDDWLQRALGASRAMLGTGWLDLYLTSPIWRFLLFPGVCGHGAWAGVMMPSVDRVNRYFPLTIAAELPALPVRLGELNALTGWLEALERVALGALDLEHSPELLDAALRDHPLPECRGASPAHAVAQRLLGHGALTAFGLPATEVFGTLLIEAATEHVLDASGPKSLWWSRGREGERPLLACCDGLPAPGDFAMLLEAGTRIMATLPVPP
jgi:type VI secretion system protein ImpM